MASTQIRRAPSAPTTMRWTVAALTLAVTLVVLMPTARAASGDSPGRGFLPDNRAWELVSPADKSGGDVVVTNTRTRASADGKGLAFVSLRGFGDVEGTAVSAEYIARRSTDGWDTHGITPEMPPLSYTALTGGANPDLRYEGEFSPDLNRGLFVAWAPLTSDPLTSPARLHLGLRSNLLDPQATTSSDLSTCPLCEATSTALPVEDSLGLILNRQALPAGASPDLSRVLFESARVLVSDVPDSGSVHLYESRGGQPTHVGRVPSTPALQCDDGPGGDPCEPLDASIAGRGVGSSGIGLGFRRPSPHAISDGSDGHTRTFFTHPTDDDGATAPSAVAGQLYMRLDGDRTVHLNASERTDCAADPTCGGDDSPDPDPAPFAPSAYADASADGTLVFLTSTEPLTDDAAEGALNLYMYDATISPSQENLTLLNGGIQPSFAGLQSFGLVGRSDDGSHLYFLGDDPTSPGAPPTLYHWHDDAVNVVGRLDEGAPMLAENTTSPGGNHTVTAFHSRVADTGVLLFAARDGESLTGYDHGTCAGQGCREFYVYDPVVDRLQCASCNPSGSAATKNATGIVRALFGSSKVGTHEPTFLSSDGRSVFFSTEEALVPDDKNSGCPNQNGQLECAMDAYVFDVEKGIAHLLSSGRSSAGSAFLDASRDGSSAFVATRERLSARDTDQSYDVYAARIDGGVPEPSDPEVECTGSTQCQGEGSAVPEDDEKESGTPKTPNQPPARRDCSRPQKRLERAKAELRRASTKAAKRKARNRVKVKRKRLASCRSRSLR